MLVLAFVSICLVVSKEVSSNAEKGVPVATTAVSMAKTTEFVIFIIIVVVILEVVLFFAWENRIGMMYCYRCGNSGIVIRFLVRIDSVCFVRVLFLCKF